MKWKRREGLRFFCLRPAGVAVGAGTVVVAAGVLEGLAGGREQVEFRAGTLREDGVAGVAVVGLYGGVGTHPGVVEILRAK